MSRRGESRWVASAVALYFVLAFAAAATPRAGALLATQPEAVHLALGGGAETVVVTWSTATETATSTVEFGADRGAALAPLDRKAVGSQANFTDGGAKRATQVVHRVELGGLVPGQRYVYHAGDAAGGWSSRFSFTAPRARATYEAQPLKLVAYCDAGDEHSLTLADVQEDVQQNRYDALIHCGDFAYDLATADGSVGDDWMRSIEPIAAYLPYMVSAGNHEEHYNFSHYKARFTMPSDGVRSENDNHYYSFDLGPAHIVAYNTEAFFWPQDFDLGYMARMYEWLEKDLAKANANRDAVPWIIVHGHRPMYCVVADKAGHCDGEHEQSRRGIPSACSETDQHLCAPTPDNAGASFPVEDLFYRYGVDLAFYGHVHDYERFWPVYNETVRKGAMTSFGRYVEPGATVHVTTGSGGNREMKLGPAPAPRGTCGQDSPWCAFQSGYYPTGDQSADYTYSRITVHNATTLEWEQWSSVTREVIDHFYVVQPNHGPFAERSS